MATIETTGLLAHTHEAWEKQFKDNHRFQKRMDVVRLIGTGTLLMGGTGGSAGSLIGSTSNTGNPGVQGLYMLGLFVSFVIGGSAGCPFVGVRHRPDLTQPVCARAMLERMENVDPDHFARIQYTFGTFEFKIKELKQSGLIDDKTESDLWDVVEAIRMIGHGKIAQENGNNARKLFHKIWKEQVIGQSPLQSVVNQV